MRADKRIKKRIGELAEQMKVKSLIDNTHKEIRKSNCCEF
jgi:hypothetical protein